MHRYFRWIVFSIAVLLFASACGVSGLATPTPVVPVLPGLLWKLSEPGSWLVGPDQVYIIQPGEFDIEGVTWERNAIIALDPNTGDERWSYVPLPFVPEFLELFEVYPADDGDVYATYWVELGDNNQSICRVQKLDGEDGTLIWTSDYKAGCGAYVFQRSGRVLFLETSDYDGVAALDAETGQLLGEEYGRECDNTVSHPTCDVITVTDDGWPFINAGRSDASNVSRLVGFDGAQGRVA